MAEIINFKAYNTSIKKCVNETSHRFRLKALSEGRIRTFTCDNCGQEFEVLYDKFPERCKGCNLIFDWERSTYDE